MPAPKGNKFAAGNKGGGRPSEYRPEYAELAQRACRLGFTDVELGELFDVDEATINRWKLEHEDFSRALVAGKSPADERVERSLFLSAVGFEYTAEKPMVVDKSVEIVQYRVRVLPNTQAQTFWLKNRRPHLWRDIQQHEIGEAGEFTNVSDEDLAKAMRAEAEALAVDLGVKPAKIQKARRQSLN